MADQGKSFTELIASLSGMGSTSANLADLSTTGEDNRIRPLTNYDSFANHVFFGNAIKKFQNSLKYIQDYYPIGSATAVDTSSLCAQNIYNVDMWKKEAKGFDLWLLDQLASTSTVTAAATNQNGEIVPLELVRRNQYNEITGSQTAIVAAISGEAHLFEEQNIALVNQTAGSANDHVVYGISAEKSVSRGPKLRNLVPEILFYGDNNEILENLLAAFGDLLDELKEYVDQISNTKKISYDDYDRIPNRFLPVLAKQFGIDLYQSALNSKVENFLIKSSSGMTTQDVTYSVWNRIMNNIIYMLKKKGTREVVESISRVYGLDHNFLKVDEFSLFNESIQIRENEEVDTPVLFSTGDVYVQMPSSVSAFDYSSSANFTLEARMSATSALNHKIIVHPLYTLELNENGQAVFSTTAGTSVSSTLGSISSWVQKDGNFTNVIASRTGDNMKVWVLSVSGSGSGSEDHVVLASGMTSGVRDINFDSSGGASAFGAYFPGSGSFSGYIHEVRAWDVALEEEDLKEHTRNFQSVSFIHSTASNSATYSSLQAHYKLKENVVLTGAYNFIVDSTTGSNTATPVNFENQSAKRYKVFSNMKKFVKWYPSGLAVDNDKVRLRDSDTRGIEDQSYVSFALKPINAVNRDIKNLIENLNIIEMLGDPEDIYRHSYTTRIAEELRNYVSRIGQNDLVNMNIFVDAMSNFNDTLGSIFPFVRQFVPAKTNILSEGLLVESPILERNKYKRQDYSTSTLTASVYGISTHHNAFDTAVSAATTGDFQGYKYDDGVQQFLSDSFSAKKNVIQDTKNFPIFSPSRIGRLNPVDVIPSNINETEIEVTLNRLMISPTASTSAYNGSINGKIRLLKSGKPFKTNTPALRIEFPASANGTNYFNAQIGDINNGKGRVINGKDLTFITKIDSNDIELILQLNNDVQSLSADTQSLSGTIGVVPIRITNLFSNAAQIVRVAIGNDDGLVSSISDQGGVKIVT